MAVVLVKIDLCSFLSDLSRILSRPSFQAVTRCVAERGERRIHHPEDKMADTARLGLGLMILMGGIYVGKKIFRK